MIHTKIKEQNPNPALVLYYDGPQTTDTNHFLRIERHCDIDIVLQTVEVLPGYVSTLF